MFEKLLKDAKIKGQRVKDHSKQYDSEHAQQLKARRATYELRHPQRRVKYDSEHAQQVKARRATYKTKHRKQIKSQKYARDKRNKGITNSIVRNPNLAMKSGAFHKMEYCFVCMRTHTVDSLVEITPNIFSFVSQLPCTQDQQIQVGGVVNSVCLRELSFQKLLKDYEAQKPSVLCCVCEAVRYPYQVDVITQHIIENFADLTCQCVLSLGCRICHTCLREMKKKKFVCCHGSTMLDYPKNRIF